MKSHILNPDLYERAKQITKKRYANAWPSAYASGALVKLYKKMGGKYSGKKNNSGIDRWFKEKWIDVCFWPKKKPCGRSQRGRAFPYCRPSVKVTKKTPRTVQSLSVLQRNKLCSKKRRNPSRRMKSLSKKRKGSRSRSRSRSRRSRSKRNMPIYVSVPLIAAGLIGISNVALNTMADVKSGEKFNFEFPTEDYAWNLVNKKKEQINDWAKQYGFDAPSFEKMPARKIRQLHRYYYKRYVFPNIFFKRRKK